MAFQFPVGKLFGNREITLWKHPKSVWVIFWLYVDFCIGIGVGIVVGVGICIGVCVGVGIGIGDGIGSINQHLASCGIWAGSIWQHVGSSVTSGIIWQHLEAPGSIWRHLTASELASGIIRTAPQSDPSSGSWKSSPGPEIKPWKPEIAKQHPFL